MTKWDKKRNKLLAKAHLWRQKHVSDAVFTFVVALLIGLCTGVGAFVLKYLIGHISSYLSQNLVSTGSNPHLLLLAPAPHPTSIMRNWGCTLNIRPMLLPIAAPA